MACERCVQLQRQTDALREQVAALKAELGLRTRDGAMGALMARFKCEAQGALLLLGLYSAKGRTCSPEFLANYAGTASTDVIKVHVCRLRKKLGADAIENEHGAGYRLTPGGLSQVMAAVEPPDVQDAKIVD